jgi:propionate CoA-transferase
MKKIITAQEAMQYIENGDTLCVCGFVGSAIPEEILATLETHFLETGSPKNMTLIHSAAIGDGDYRGVNRFAHEGMLKRIIGGHFNFAPKLGKLISENKIEAYNWPQGTIAQWLRDVSARKPGIITKVGLNTFIDPRVEGGKLNSVTQENLIKVITMEDEEYLWYKPFPINVAILRGTTADLNGNISTEHEAVKLELLSYALAAKANGGTVIVQVERVVENGNINPKNVVLPGIDVDYIVVASNPLYHEQSYGTPYQPAYSGEIRMPLSEIPPMLLNARKVIARRATMELVPNAIVNLGVGIPEGVSSVANEEGVGQEMTLTVEAGPIGGIPAGGNEFGASANAQAIVDHPYQFDFYDGGGLDIAYLGLAETNSNGDINVSKFKGRVAGCGGFINITQNTHKVVFCGTFTAKGLKEKVENGKLVILQEGSISKFLKKIDQITFSGTYAQKHNQEVMYVTERCVFRLSEKGIVLTEIAPGIDLEKDVLEHMEFKPLIADNLKLMDQRIFKDEVMGLTI